MAGPTTAGLAALIEGEDWRYVGDTDQPAFENSWANEGLAGQMAFRIRESGIVDLQGYVGSGTPGSTVFTLPADYRPSNDTYLISKGGTAPCLVVISDDGFVFDAEPGTNTTFYIVGQFFLNPPVP